MPYSGTKDSKLPDAVKKLSKELQKIWIAVFNKTYPKGEADAFKAAWGAVNKIRYAKKKKEGVIPMIITEEEKKELFLVREWDLSSAEIQEKEDTGNYIMTFIKEGWSKNNYYWSKERLYELDGLINDSAKMYLNHIKQSKNGTNIIGRDIRDWAGQIVKHWIDNTNEDGKLRLKGEVHIFEKIGGCPDDFLRERVSKFPNEVGSSVDTWCKIKKGEVDGKKGTIIEKVAFLESNDFVTRPSAGGVVEKRVGESEIFYPLKELYLGDYQLEGSYEELINNLNIALREEANKKNSEIRKTVKIPKTNKNDLVSREWYPAIVGTFPNKTIFRMDSYSIYDSPDLYQADYEKNENNEFIFSNVKKIDLKIILQSKEGEIVNMKNYENLTEQEFLDAMKLLGNIKISETEFSDKAWGSIKKSELPASCYLIVPDKAKPSTWKLPYREGAGELKDDPVGIGKRWTKAGPVNKGALRAILGLKGGARIAKGKAKLTIPDDAWKKVLRLAKQAGIESKYLEENKQSYSLYDTLKTKKGGSNMFNINEYNEWKSQNPDFLEQLIKEIKEKMNIDERLGKYEEMANELKNLKEELQTIKEERDEFEKKLDDYRTKEKVREEEEKKQKQIEQRDKMIAESKIPEKYISDKFKELVRNAESDEEAQSLIKDRKDLVSGESGKVRGNGPVKGTQETHNRDDTKLVKDEIEKLLEKAITH